MQETTGYVESGDSKNTGIKNTCFVVTACPKDVHYARILLASMHWFHPDCPVVVIGDGGVKPSALRKLPNLHRFIESDGIPASRSLLLRGLLSKLNLFFLEEFNYYVAFDADSILIGDLRRTLAEQMPAEFLGLDGIGEFNGTTDENRRAFSHYAFSIDEARERAPYLRPDSLVFFSSGHFCVRRNPVWASLIEGWRHEMGRDFSPETFFRFGDQGFLNFAVNTLKQAGQMEVKMASVAINGKCSPAEYPWLTKRSLIERIETRQKVIHYTSPSRRFTLKAHNFGWALEHFEQYCYSWRGKRTYLVDKALYLSSKLSSRVRKSRPGTLFTRIARKAGSPFATRQRAINRLRLQRRVSLALSQISSPFVVKVGANDGVTGDPLFPVFNNRLDWKGLFIEPVPSCFAKLKENYPDRTRFVVENVAVDYSLGQKAFYCVREDAKRYFPALPPWWDQIGSFDRKHILKHLNGALEPYIEKCSISCVPLPAILQKHGVERIDVLHIDTEGHDFVVLRQVDFNKYSPIVILFEYKHMREEERADSVKLLRLNHYRIFDCGGDCLAVSYSRAQDV